MNKTIIYVLAAVVGVGLAVALFPKSEAPDISSELGARGVKSEGAAARGASGDPAKPVTIKYDPELPKRAAKPPKVEGEVSEPGPKPSGAREAYDAQQASTAGSHVKASTMKWQGLSYQLRKAGHTAEADRAGTMAAKLNKLRRETTIDLEALLTEETELLKELTAEVSDEEIDPIAESIRELITTAREGDEG